MREKINITNNGKEIAIAMSEGNPGGLRVIMQMLVRGGPQAMISVLDLDDMNIRGEQIWLGYKDHCGEDLDKFIELARRRDVGMVETINKYCSSAEVAVTSGASFAHR